jgi:hypothetical protein
MASRFMWMVSVVLRSDFMCLPFKLGSVEPHAVEALRTSGSIGIEHGHKGAGAGDGFRAGDGFPHDGRGTTVRVLNGAKQ